MSIFFRIRESKHISGFGDGFWFSIIIGFQSDPSVGDVDVDGSRAFGLSATGVVVDYFDSKGSGEDVLDQRVGAGATESVEFSVECTVVVLSPGHRTRFCECKMGSRRHD